MTKMQFIEYAESVCFAKPWTYDQIWGSVGSVYGIYEVIEDVGYALGNWSFDEAELHRLAVLPDKRRAGAGSELLERFIRSCEKRDVKKIFLEVRSQNTPAVKMYEKHGFRLISKRKGYYGDDDALIYELEIQ